MQFETPGVRRRRVIAITRVLAITAALLVSACTTPGDATDAIPGEVRTTGVIVSIDTQPWAYDGNAIVQLDTADDGRLQVQLPARWNLCKAAPVDVEALAVGMQVEVAGAASEAGVVVVCADPAHRLAPVDAS